MFGIVNRILIGVLFLVVTPNLAFQQCFEQEISFIRGYGQRLQSQVGSRACKNFTANVPQRLDMVAYNIELPNGITKVRVISHATADGSNPPRFKEPPKSQWAVGRGCGGGARNINGGSNHYTTLNTPNNSEIVFRITTHEPNLNSVIGDPSYSGQMCVEVLETEESSGSSPTNPSNPTINPPNNTSRPAQSGRWDKYSSQNLGQTDNSSLSSLVLRYTADHFKTAIQGDAAITGGSVLCDTKNNNGQCNFNSNSENWEMQLKYVKDDSSFAYNSSMAPISLPPRLKKDDIKFARLYWQGFVTKIGSSTTRDIENLIKDTDKITLKMPNGQKRTFTAEASDVFYTKSIANGDQKRDCRDKFTWVTAPREECRGSGSRRQCRQIVSEDCNTASARKNNARYWYAASVDVTDFVKENLAQTLSQISFREGNNPINVNIVAGDIKTNGGSFGGTTYGDGDTDLIYVKDDYFKDTSSPGGYKYISRSFGATGGWSLVIVYDKEDTDELPTEIANRFYKYKKVTIYDGYKRFEPLETPDRLRNITTRLDFRGFYTPTNGEFDAKLALFLFNGKKQVASEYLKMQNARNNDMLENLTDGKNPAGNQYNGTVSVFGQDLRRDRPVNVGMDLDVYDVKHLLKNRQKETSIQLGTEATGSGANLRIDEIYLSYAIFSTDLYTPKVCYEERIFNTDTGGDFSENLVTEEGDPVRIVTKFKNKGNEDAEFVGVNFILDENLTYIPNTTKIDNSMRNLTYNASSMRAIRDNSGLQKVEDVDRNRPDVKKMSINVGDGASDSEGGLLVANGDKFAFAEFNATIGKEYNPKKRHYKANFSNEDIGLVIEGFNMPTCDDRTQVVKVIPAVGQFLLTNFNNPQNRRLYTQVINQKFKIALRYYPKKKKEDVKPPYGKFVAKLVQDTPYIRNLCSLSFKEIQDRGLKGAKVATSRELADVTIPIYKKTGNGSPRLHNIQYDVDMSNSDYLSWQEDISDLVVLNYAQKKIPYNKLLFFMIFYETDRNGRELDYVRFGCSDLFAVKPTKFVLSNNLPHITQNGQKYSYIGKYKRTDRNTEAIMVDAKDDQDRLMDNFTNHNRLLKNTLVEPLDAMKSDFKNGCPVENTALENGKLEFVDGMANFTNEVDGTSNVFAYNQPGRAVFGVRDSQWTLVDQPNDCIVGSNINTHNSEGLVGCDISSQNNLTINFIPKKFVNREIAISNFSGNVTFLNKGTTKGMNTADFTQFMGANLDFKLHAVDPFGNTMQAYDQRCIDLMMPIDIALAKNSTFDKTPVINEILPSWENPMIYQNQDEYQVNGTDPNNKTITLQGRNFVNGVVSGNFKLNYAREVTTPQNPGKILPQMYAFNSTGAILVEEEKTLANYYTGDATFVYGRAFAPTMRGKSPVAGNLYYTAYCDNCNTSIVNGILNPSESINELPKFFRVQTYQPPFEQVRNLVPVSSGVTASLVAPQSQGKQSISIAYNGTDLPKTEYIKIDAPSWLVYNQFLNNATYNEFAVTFIGNGGNWSGFGSQGDVLGDTEDSGDKIKTNRIEW